jgi:hypothetical protein
MAGLLNPDVGLGFPGAVESGVVRGRGQYEADEGDYAVADGVCAGGFVAHRAWLYLLPIHRVGKLPPTHLGLQALAVHGLLGSHALQDQVPIADSHRGSLQASRPEPPALQAPRPATLPHCSYSSHPAARGDHALIADPGAAEGCPSRSGGCDGLKWIPDCT